MVTHSPTARGGSVAPPAPGELAALQLPAFLEILPAPGRLTVDLSCGSGIVGRLLAARGHTLIGTESDPRAARTALMTGGYDEVLLATPPTIPLPDAAASLVVAWMAYDFADDLDSAVGEASRVLAPGGSIALAVLEAFTQSALAPGHQPPHALATTTRGGHWVLVRTTPRQPADYLAALDRAGFVNETVAEPCPPPHLPSFLHVLAVKPQLGRQLVGDANDGQAPRRCRACRVG